ncbi:MAG TPA: DNA gyrase inhibitor YacG [Sphingomicrobium sp.]|nr:DNA gyrase inhibitor YacG [Sphingomicrobium sp.]
MPNLPKPCPYCGESPAAPYAPFCSQGCKDRDLLKWLGEGYRIPGCPTRLGGLDSDEDDS